MTRKLLTLDEVGSHATLLDYDKTKPVDFIGKNEIVDYDNDIFTLKVGKKDFMLTNTGVKSLLDGIKAPNGLMKKFANDPELISYIINRTGMRNGVAGNALIKDNSVVGFSDADEKLISNGDILSVISNKINSPMLDKFYMNEDGSSGFYVVSQDDVLKVNNRDRYANGVLILNNPLKGNSTSVEGYLERLKCLNGQIVADSVWKAGKSITQDPSVWLGRSIQTAMKNSKKTFASIKDLKNHTISLEMATFLESMYRDLKIPVAARDFISRRIMEHGAENMYDIYNHVTYVASNYQEVRDNVVLSGALMRSSGDFANNIESLCNACSRPKFGRN